MKNILLTLILAGFSMVSYAQKTKHQDWTSTIRSGFYEAYTFNESDASFGLFCMEKCFYYVDMNVKCKEGDKYSALMATSNGSTSVTLNCFTLKDRWISLIEPFDDVSTMIKGSESVGFAIALKSGKFNVSRFSLNGSSKAMEAILIEAVKNNERKNSGFKNQLL